MIKNKFSCPLKSLILVLFLFSSLLAEDKNNSEIIAKIGSNYTISFSDLKNYVYENFYHKIYLKEKSKGYLPALEQIINKRLKVIDFFERGLDKNKTLVSKLNRILNEELYNEYYEKYYSEKYVTESNIQKVYQSMGRTVYFQQILLHKGLDLREAIIDSIKSLAMNLKKQAEEGKDFTALAKIFSDDTLTIGSTLKADWKKNLLSPIYNIIFNLPKGAIRVLEDSQSFYVIKIIDVEYTDVEPLEKVIDDIKSTLKTAFSYSSIKDFENEQSKLIDEKSIKWNQSALNKLVTWSKIPGFYDGLYKDTIQNALSKGKNFRILSSSRYKVDLKKYLQLLDEVLILGRSTIIKEQDIKNFILEALKIEAIANKARKLGMFNDVFNPFTKSQILVDEIAKLYDSEIIEKQIPEPDEKNLKMFYEENKDSLYYQLAKVNIYVAFASDTIKIDSLKKKYSKGIPFEKLDNRIFVKRFIRQKDGSIKADHLDQDTSLASIAFKLNQDEIAGPIKYESSDSSKKFALIKCVHKREEKQLLYDDVKKNIKDDFIKFYRDKISKEILNNLTTRYGVEIYYESLKKKLSEIGIVLN
ncbi:peptidylprolyl isomerase [Rosettibacter firmus]|uniref:peptidylprolyl isomerase n=1 Tax=Rosettibacter firmus TaxID=3111522 RepID=UPI00336BDC20